MGRAPETPLPRGSIGFRELWPNFNQVTADLLQDQLENWAIMDLDLRYTAKSTSNKVGWTSICGRIDRHRFIDSTNKDQIRFCKWWAGKTHNGRRFRDGYTKSDNSDGDDEDIDGNRTNSHQVADESQVVPLHIRGSHQEGGGTKTGMKRKCANDETKEMGKETKKGKGDDNQVEPVHKRTTYHKGYNSDDDDSDDESTMASGGGTKSGMKKENAKKKGKGKGKGRVASAEGCTSERFEIRAGGSGVGSAGATVVPNQSIGARALDRTQRLEGPATHVGPKQGKKLADNASKFLKGLFTGEELQNWKIAFLKEGFRADNDLDSLMRGSISLKVDTVVSMYNGSRGGVSPVQAREVLEKLGGGTSLGYLEPW